MFRQLGVPSVCLRHSGEESHCFDKFLADIQHFPPLILLDLFYQSICSLNLKYFSGVECILSISHFFFQATAVTSGKSTIIPKFKNLCSAVSLASTFWKPLLLAGVFYMLFNRTNNLTIPAHFGLHVVFVFLFCSVELCSPCTSLQAACHF